MGLIIPLVAGHVRQMGGNHLYVGLLGSIYAGFQLGSGPFIVSSSSAITLVFMHFKLEDTIIYNHKNIFQGSLSDLKGRKTILTMTLLMCGIAYTVLGLTSSIFVIMVIRAVLGTYKNQLISIHTQIICITLHFYRGRP